MRQAVVEQAGRAVAEMLESVERGEEVVLTRAERTVARLVPTPREPDMVSTIAASDRLRALRASLAARGVRVTQAEIRAMRDEGRG